MAVPKQRHTKSRRNRRRSHLGLKGGVFGDCQKCGSPIEPHHVCTNCGFYKGREVVNVLAKMRKKEKKEKEKELVEQEKTQQANKPLDAKELSKKS